MQLPVVLSLLLLLSLVSAGLVTNQSCIIGGDYGPLLKDNWVTITPDQSGCSRVQFDSYFSNTPATLTIGILPQAAPNDVTLTSVVAYPVNSTSSSLLPPVTYLTVTQYQVDQSKANFTCYQYPNGTGSMTELYFLVNTNITAQIYVTIVSELSESQCYAPVPNGGEDASENSWWWFAIVVIILVLVIVIVVAVIALVAVVYYCFIKRKSYNQI